MMLKSIIGVALNNINSLFFVLLNNNNDQIAHFTTLYPSSTYKILGVLDCLDMTTGCASVRKRLGNADLNPNPNPARINTKEHRLDSLVGQKNFGRAASLVILA